MICSTMFCCYFSSPQHKVNMENTNLLAQKTCSKDITWSCNTNWLNLCSTARMCDIFGIFLLKESKLDCYEICYMCILWSPLSTFNLKGAWRRNVGLIKVKYSCYCLYFFINYLLFISLIKTIKQTVCIHVYRYKERHNNNRVNN